MKSFALIVLVIFFNCSLIFFYLLTVWVARMEVKCIEESGVDLHVEDEECERSDSDRRESGSSGERRESAASSGRRESTTSSCRRESGSSWERRESAASRRESESCEERGDGDTRDWRRESRSDDVPGETTKRGAYSLDAGISFHNIGYFSILACNFLCLYLYMQLSLDVQ